MVGEPVPNTGYLTHPLAEIVPRMSDDEFLDLRKSIREHGLLAGEEIVLHEGKILDGRHRHDACLREGVEPRFREYTGTDPEGYVLAKLTRRNLDESTRALVAGRLLAARCGPGGDKLRQDDVRRRFGLGETIVMEAVRVVKLASPGLVRMVENGEVKMKQAAAVARLPRKEQEQVVAAGAGSVKIKAAQLKKSKVKLPLRPSAPDRPAVVVRQFDSATADLLQKIKGLAASLTRHLKSAEGAKFAEYVRLAHPETAGWIDYGRVKLTDKGEGLEAVNAAFTGLQPLYRMLVAASRDRAYPASELLKLLGHQGGNVLDGDRPPPEPEDAPAQLVEPESL